MPPGATSKGFRSIPVPLQAAMLAAVSDLLILACLACNVLTLVKLARLEQALRDLPCERGRRHCAPAPPAQAALPGGFGGF